MRWSVFANTDLEIILDTDILRKFRLDKEKSGSIGRSVKRFSFALALTVIVAPVWGPFTVSALTSSDLHSIYNDSPWYKIGGNICSPTFAGDALEEGSKVYLLGDSIGTQIQGQINSTFSGRGFDFIADVVSGRTLPQGIEAVRNNPDGARDADVVIVQLGTNAGGFSSANVRELVNTIRSVAANASIFWVDTVVVERVAYAITLSNVNEIIQSQASSNGYGIISWNKEVFGSSADPTNINPNAPDNGYIRRADQFVHLTDSGVDAMSRLISSTVVGESSPSDNAFDCACTGGGGSVEPGSNNAETIWRYLIGQGLTELQAAGIMGNLRAEAGFEPRRVEYAWSDPPHLSDTVPPDIGPQGQPGYGIVQWTSQGRKQGLRNLSAERGVMAGDLLLQLEYLWQELNGPYASVLSEIRASTTLEEATYIFLEDFEVPADIAGNRPIRLRYATEILAQFTGTAGGIPGLVDCGDSGAPPGTEIDVDNLGRNSDNIACPEGARDLGVVTTRYTGAYKQESGPLIIRLCQIPEIAGQGNNSSGVEISGGAVVNSRVAGAWQALGRAAQTANISLYSDSSFRLADSCGGTGDGGACATPGGSPHQMGVAIDFYNQMYAIDTSRQSCSVRITRTDSPQWRWMYINADRYGFEQYSAEAWHWDPLPSSNRCNQNEPPNLVPTGGAS